MVNVSLEASINSGVDEEIFNHKILLPPSKFTLGQLYADMTNRFDTLTSEEM